MQEEDVVISDKPIPPFLTHQNQYCYVDVLRGRIKAFLTLLWYCQGMPLLHQSEKTANVFVLTKFPIATFHISWGEDRS